MTASGKSGQRRNRLLGMTLALVAIGLYLASALRWAGELRGP